jgi:hypothetical protein
MAITQSANTREHGLFLKFSGAINREVYICGFVSCQVSVVSCCRRQKGGCAEFPLGMAIAQSANTREHGLFLKFSETLGREVYILLKRRKAAKKREWDRRGRTHFLREW